MTTSSCLSTVEASLERLDLRFRRVGDQVDAQCPAHQDDNPSLSVTYDADAGKVLVNCHVGCSSDDVVAALDLFDPKTEQDRARRPEIVATRSGRGGGLVNMLDAALDYARGGALVLPLHTPTAAGCSCRRRDCAHVGKHPRTMRGLHDATADLDTVARWWGVWPEANVGVRPHLGQVVVDVDPRHGGNVQLAAMQDRYGPLPVTCTARTGGGGLHLWFLCHGEVRGELAPGVDVKSNSGFLVCAPSLHESGQRYEWINEGPIVEAPEYLQLLLARPTPVIPSGTGTVTPAVVAGLVRTVAEAPPGTRNSRLYWACSRAFEKGVDINPLVEAAVTNGLSRHEAERTAASAASAPGRVVAQ